MESSVAGSENLRGLLGRLWGHLSRRRKRQAVLLPFLMLISGFAEVISLGAVIPFLGILTAPEQVFEYPVVASVAGFLGIASADEMVMPLTAGFVMAVVTAGAIRLLLLWANIRFSNACGADLSIEVYRRTLYQPYSMHVIRNSSDILGGIKKVSSAQTVLQCMLTVVTSSVLVTSILLALLSINAEVAMVAAFGFGFSYLVIVKLTRWRLERNGKRVARETTQMIKALQEGLGGIRDVLLDGSQSLYCKIYSDSLMPATWASASSQFMGVSPRYIMEVLGMVLIAGLAFSLSFEEGGLVSAMPLLAALALGAQRMLPAFQQLYASWAAITGSRASLADALDLLDQPLPDDASSPEPKPLDFKRDIHFDEVRFRYKDDSPWVLDGLNLDLPKGARIGFVGGTGGGKSTLLDLLMGLLEPVEGQILVDGVPIRSEHRRSWQKAIAHVPQAIYLADTTIAENIALGVPSEDIDYDRVKLAAQQAQIADFIEAIPDAYRSHVGERGVRLSGGQRQRIGIARALYKRARVLVFDEATSALDNATEQAIVDSMASLDRNLTVLLVAHRLTTVRHCDIIIELQHGRVVAQGTFEQLLDSSPSFRNMVKSVA